MNHAKKLLVFILCTIFLVNISGCSRSKASNDEKQFSIYIDTKDKESQNILKFMIDEYKKDNPKVKITASNVIGDKIEDQISKSSDIDLLCVSRNDMIKIIQKGLLSDIGNFYDENKINDKYYTVVNAYGRFQDKYYGIPIMPYTMEILYNKNSFTSLKLKPPNNVNDVNEVLKKLNQMSMRVPVVLSEDMDINTAVLSMIVNNNISMRKLEKSYDNVELYKNLSEMKSAFNSIQSLVKEGVINKNTFELGNENSIKKFNNGDIPIVITSSYYTKELINNKNISIVDYTNSSSSKVNVPVICNSILCMSVNTKNSEEANKFMKFATSYELSKKLTSKGYVTGNKKANKVFKDNIDQSIVNQLSESTEDNVLYIYNIPEKLKNSISSQLQQVLNGKTSNDLWDEIIRDA